MSSTNRRRILYTHHLRRKSNFDRFLHTIFLYKCIKSLFCLCKLAGIEGKDPGKIKIWKKNFGKNFEKNYFKTKILITKICNSINKYDTIFALLASLKNREKQGVMKKCAHAHSALIQNSHFDARIARKECGHFNKVGRKLISVTDNIRHPKN